jgi:Asp-tRNA(Asn)/Glu-tRNA(Gln) amidotransferase A subunit family amidase
VRDTARAFDAIAGHDPEDAYSSERVAGGTAGRLTGDLRGIRAGILDGDYFMVDRDPEIGSAFESAIATLSALRVRMTRVRFELASAAHAAAMLITLAEADSTQDEGIRATPEAYGDDVRGQLHLGEFISARQYLRALRIRSRIQGELEELFSRVDVLLTPTTPTFPSRIDRMQGSGMVQFARNTRPFSVAGLPAVSVPAGFSTGRLPVGLQVIGRPFDDATVLNVAHAHEQATDWHLQWPPCAAGDA